MRLARVERALWGDVRAEGLESVKLLEVRALEFGAGGGLAPGETTWVALDRLQAGPGDRVLVAHGSRVRDIGFGEGVPAKDVVIAIVDDVWMADEPAGRVPERG